MNTVPFEQLGPGQSGRLAYQVLGQNGPIFNPQNIRYLSPDSVEIPATSMGAGASALSAGLAGANLIGSVLNLGVSLFNAFQISGLHSRMNRIERKIDHIVSKVDRIDTQVAENNLRHALEHVLRKSVSSEGVDLRVLAGLCHDFDKFKESLPSPLLLNFGLRLASDIRDYHQLIYDLAYGTRKLVAQRYNTSVDGDPEHIIIIDPTKDYFFDNDLKVLVKANMYFHQIYEMCGIGEDYKWKSWVKEAYEETFVKLGWLNFDNYLPESHSDEDSEAVGQGLFKKLAKIFREPEAIERGLYDYNNDSPPTFREIRAKAIERGLYDLSYGWLYQTDAGLLWRTKIELDAIASGYENTFWPELKDAEPCGFNQIEVACDVPLLENT